MRDTTMILKIIGFRRYQKKQNQANVSNSVLDTGKRLIKGITFHDKCVMSHEARVDI
jgi:hypothetical protein